MPELSLLKFLPLTYHHNHFLAATLQGHCEKRCEVHGLHIFFHNGLLRGRTLFLHWADFGLDRQNLKNSEKQSTNFNLFFSKLTHVPLFHWALSINSTISFLYFYINRVYLCCRLHLPLLAYCLFISLLSVNPLTASTGFIHYNTTKAL